MEGIVQLKTMGNLISGEDCKHSRKRIQDSLCIVMPVYNEEEIVAKVLHEWVDNLDKAGICYVIRAYNDGSIDGSLNVMRKVAEEIGGGKVDVRDKKNGGHGNTILQGYREAAQDGFDWIFQVDSDGEMSPEMFFALWSRKNDNDLLVGRRKGRVQVVSRKLISFVSRLVVRIFYGKSVWDVNTPYRLMRVEKFKGWYDALPLSTFAPNVILSGIAAHEKFRNYETYVEQHDRTTGEVSIKNWKLLNAAIRSLSQTVSFAARFSRTKVLFGIFCAISVFMKLLVSLRGWNFDYESYCIVSDIVVSGGNVYAETSRYNYGPVWFNILGMFKILFGSCFRFSIIVFLSLIDVGIALILWRKRLFIPAFIK